MNTFSVKYQVMGENKAYDAKIQLGMTVGELKDSLGMKKHLCQIARVASFDLITVSVFDEQVIMPNDTLLFAPSVKGGAQ